MTRFGWLAAVILSGLVAAQPAMAQGDGNLPLCETSTGLDGTLFVDIQSFINVPVAFDAAEAVPPIVHVIPGVTAPSGTYAFSAETGRTKIDFSQQGVLVYACEAEVIAFDPAVHDLASVVPGPCDWTFDRDMPLLTGLARFASIPERFIEVSVGNPGVADIAPISNRSVYLIGRTTGVTNVVLLDENAVVYQQCPAVVEDGPAYFDRHGFDEDQRCRDASGLPLRFSPGQPAYVAMPDGSSEVIVGDTDIAAARITGPTEMEVSPQAPGITNVVAVRYGTGLVHECLIVVD